MKNIKSIIGGIALMSGLLAFVAPASAAWNDRRELDHARHELRQDYYHGAGPRELARDRAAIARERRDIWQDRRDWRHDRWHDDYRYRPWYRS